MCEKEIDLMKRRRQHKEKETRRDAARRGEIAVVWS